MCVLMRRGVHAAGARSSLSAPRMTIPSASSGNGRCNTFASSHGARIQTSRSSSVVRITGIAFGWIGSTTAFGDVVRESVDLMRPRHRLRLRAAITVERRPDASEGEQRSVIVECEPDHVLFLGLGVRLRRVLGEAVDRDQAAVLWLEPAAPMCRIQSVRQTLATNQPLSRAMLNQLRDLKYRIVSRPSR